MHDWFGIVFFGIIGLVFVLMVLAMAIVLPARHRQFAEDLKKCEAAGGIYLDRTYQSGKVTNHLYTCVKADAVIF
jgi:hypothetical protein